MVTDYLLDANVEQTSLQRAFAEALRLPISEVCVVSEFDERTPKRLAIVVTYPRLGEFALMLSVFVNTESPPEAAALASKIAKLLGVRVLTDDGLPNPYTMIMIDAAGLQTSVSFDESRYDELDEIWLRKKP